MSDIEASYDCELLANLCLGAVPEDEVEGNRATRRASIDGGGGASRDSTSVVLPFLSCSDWRLFGWRDKKSIITHVKMSQFRDWAVVGWSLSPKADLNWLYAKLEKLLTEAHDFEKIGECK